MTYEETLHYIYASQPAFHQVGAKAYKPGLGNIEALLQHIGNPEKQLKTIHIAGTNGKGSTSHLIAATLQAAGYKTGLYTSPHLVDFRERIRVNGEMIDKDFVVQFVAQNQAFMEQIRPSFFEAVTALCFAYFAAQKVDYAVIETGLGGRLDSTNVLRPLLSVITNIGLDHTEFLGSTLPQIAFEKAGIIKPKTPVVIGETNPETQPVFEQKAASLLSPIVFADQQAPVLLPCQLKGLYQQKNIQTAGVALQELRKIGVAVPDSALTQGFASVCDLTGLRGRWETLQLRPLVICDTGHNSHGITYVAQQLKQMQGQYETLRIVFGMVSDKDVEVVLRLLPRNAVYYFTQAQTHRAIAAADLLQMGQNAGLQGRAFDSVELAVAQALQESHPQDLLFMGGSNYVVGEILPLFPPSLLKK